MNVSRLLVLVAICLGPIGIVQADLGLDSRAPVPAPVLSVQATASIVSDSALAAQQHTVLQPAVSGGVVDPLECGVVRTQDWAAADLAGPFQSTTETLLSRTQSPEMAVRELPAAPGSSALFAAAMLSAGVWQALRKARHAQWGHLPDWYHADAPQQIGHSVAFDPTLGFELLAVCVFDAPIEADSSPLLDFSRDFPSRHESQHFLTIQSPRAPPTMS